MIIEEARREREIAEHSDGNATTYHDSLGAILQVHGVPGGGTPVVIAVPVARLATKDRARNAGHRFATLLQWPSAIRRAARSQGNSIHSARGRCRMMSAKDAWLSAYVVVQSRPGTWDAMVSIADSTYPRATGELLRGVPIPAFDGGTLALSDPILGRAGAGLVWHWDGNAIPLNPTNAWHRSESAILSYAIDGLIPGHTYATTVELWRTKGTPKAPSLRIGFTATAQQARETIQRELALHELDPGEYRLVLRVDDSATGSRGERTRFLAVLR
ncbi:MAG TPA: hypothetical protein VHW65_11855 [Gemmatimonadales bacterium]|jgi:hypothetical protein|nr:hypothetical protein [Gemmatimonadales bacterium]